MPKPRSVLLTDRPFQFMNRDHCEAAAATLGAEFVRARQYGGLTQRGLAAKAGLGRVTLANLEAGRGSVGALISVLAVLEHRFADQPPGTELGRWIAQSRKRVGLSQERLCALAGISKPALVRVERSEGNVSTMVAAMTGLGLALQLIDAALEAAPQPIPEPTARLLHGDCRNRMRDFAQEGQFFDAIGTDPPYHLASTSRRFGRKEAAPLTGDEPDNDNPYRTIATGFLGQKWDGGGVAFEAETWRAAYAVLKPGAHLIAFGGPRTFHRLAVAIEEAGFEIRDTIMWLYGSGFPKSLNLRGDQQGRGTALKPAYEPIVIARKPILESSVAANVMKFGTGGINIDACRIPTDERIEQGRVGRKLGASVALTGPGLPATDPAGVRHMNRPTSRPGSKGIASYTEANVAAGIRPTTSLKQCVEPPRSENGRWPANVILSGIDETWGRYFYAAKASKADRGTGNTHPTVKPNSLMRYLVRLVTPPGGTVFDPFAGSGSTGVAAIQEGLSFIGTEMMSDYIEIARRRIQTVMPAGSRVELDLDEGSGLGKVAL
jgi:site-specific DNA-methyltransferase (adenine-specific)